MIGKTIVDTETTKIPIDNRIEFRNADYLEPQWLYDLRLSAWEKYLETPLPERTRHLWKYTDPAKFIFDDPKRLMGFLPSLEDGTKRDLKEMPAQYSGFGYNQSDLFINARMMPEFTNKGVIFKNLYVASKENPEVEEYLGKLIGHDFGKIEALNASLWNNGLYLYIPDNIILEKPIYMFRHPTGQKTISRLLVIVGDNAQVTFIDDYSCHCQNPGAIFNSVVEIFAGQSSQVRYLNSQRLSPDFKLHISQRAQIGQNTDYQAAFGAIGAGLIKVNSGTILNGRGANSRMSGVLVGNNNQHFDYHTVHRHNHSESFSNLDFRAVLRDQAMSAYTGLIRVEREALNCEAYQENRNLLLNKGAKAESIPELEILTDQVRCTHGATMGPIDPEMLFYLTSRGISRDEAISSIVGGFVEPTLTKLPNDMAQYLREIVQTKLSNGSSHKGNGHGS